MELFIVFFQDEFLSSLITWHRIKWNLSIVVVYQTRGFYLSGSIKKLGKKKKKLGHLNFVLE